MRSVLLVAHTGRDQIVSLADQAARRLQASGLHVRVPADMAAALSAAPVRAVANAEAAADCELVLVLGGDGTFLRAAELARPFGVPLLGVNLGHVGFLAEVEPDTLAGTVDAIVGRAYEVDERMTVEAQVWVGEQCVAQAWALNEASLERINRERMLELQVAVDGRPLLRFGCDGVLCSTPTGSTAYAFSIGGPIVWPNVEALVVAPNAAHALFSRAIVVAPTSVVEIELLSESYEGVLSCDGRRSLPVPSGARVRVRRGEVPVRIARLPGWSFADRLVTKFQLPARTLREVAPPPEARTLE